MAKTKMEQFIDALELAFALSLELGSEGIDRVEWRIRYTGTTDATAKAKCLTDSALVNAGCKLKSGAA